MNESSNGRVRVFILFSFHISVGLKTSGCDDTTAGRESK